ncbi:MAG: glycosyltransferase family 1 protein [Planctomycetota bacterium]
MILIDGRAIHPHLSGIGRYTLNLLHGLDAVGRDDTLGPIKVWVRPDAPLPDALTRSEALDLIERDGRPQDATNQLRGQRELRQMGVELFHCPDVFVPWGTKCRRVVTIHDVIPLVCRGMLHRSRKQKFARLWRAWSRTQARAAEGVITVSRYSATDIQRQLGVAPQRIHVIHNAVAPMDKSAGRAADNGHDPLAPRGIRGPFVLNVGRRDPYKNVDGLVRAFATLRQRFTDVPDDLQLVLVGDPDPRYPAAEQEVRRLGLEDAVVFTGYTSEATLAELYRRAAVLAMPSLYEGFGLPAVEAMRAGTPVVAGAVASLPEVVGDAGLLFDAHRPEALVEAMHKVLVDHELTDILRERGWQRIEQFSLEKAGARHVALYRQLLQPAPGTR